MRAVASMGKFDGKSGGLIVNLFYFENGIFDNSDDRKLAGPT